MKNSWRFFLSLQYNGNFAINGGHFVDTPMSALVRRLQKRYFLYAMLGKAETKKITLY